MILIWSVETPEQGPWGQKTPPAHWLEGGEYTE